MRLCTFLWSILVTFDIIGMAGSSSVDTGNLIPCKQSWFLYGGKCYKIIGTDKGLDWKQASIDCSLKRGKLATVYSAQLQEFLVMFLLQRAQKNAWIALNDREKESEYTWEDRSPVNYTNWDENEPTGIVQRKTWEDCVEMRYQNWTRRIGTWNDRSCDIEQPYFCQADKSEDVLSPDPRFCSVFEGGGWKYFNSCYHVVTEAKTWEDAESHCKEKYNGHLVAILDENTAMFVKFLIPEYETFWIGIKIRNQRIQLWSSGLHVGYKNWDHEPKQFLPGTCSMMSNKNLWEIVPCFHELPFICEKSNYSVPVLKKSPEGWRCPSASSEWIDLDGEYCYLFETAKSVTWNEAHYECVRKGGTLASIRSEAESYVLHQHVKNTQPALFFGLHRNLSNKNVFEWANGNKLDYTNWQPGEPNTKGEECGEILTSSMKWNDIQCSKTRGYICSAKKVPLIAAKLNASVPNECVCRSGMSSETVSVIVVCILLIVILTGLVLYHYRNFCKRLPNSFIHNAGALPSLNHISSVVIFKREEFECGK